MRLPAVNCILLACIATTIFAEDSRPKRDLLYLKDIIASKLFGSSQDNITNSVPVEPLLIRQDGDVKIFRIPGFDNILVKAVPKPTIKVVQTAGPIPEKSAVFDPTIAILESYLGTETHDETLNALQGVKNLLQSGILFKPKPVPTIHGPPKVPLIPVLPPSYLAPISVLQDMFPVKSVKVAVPVPTKYSYKQVQHDGSVTSHTVKNGSDVVVTQTNKPMPPPPPYIMERIQQICLRPPPMSLQPIPVRPALSSIPLSPALPPMPSVVVPRPVVYNIPYGPVVMPPMQTVMEGPIEIKVNPYYQKQHYNPADIVIQEPVLVPGPPSYIVDRIEQATPKTHGGYSFNIINNDYQKIVSHPRPHAYRDSFLFKPHAPRYAYRQLNRYVPHTLTAVNVPRFNTYGELTVKANEHPPTTTYADPTSTSGTYSYKQVNQDGSLTSYSGTERNHVNPMVLITDSSRMPPPPVHIVDRIEKAAATAHAIKLHTTPSSGYSFKTINNEVAYNTGLHTTAQSSNTPIAVEASKPVNPSGINMYSYKKIRDGKVSTYLANGARKGNPEVLVSNSQHMPAPMPQVVDRIEKVAATAHADKNSEFLRGETNTPNSVLFEKPVTLTYVYKQVNSNNPKPFTVVKVENELKFTDKGVNTQEPVQSYGTNQPKIQLIPEVPREFVYVPPAASEKTNTPPSQFSYKQVTNHGVYKNQGGSVNFKDVSGAPKVSHHEQTTLPSDPNYLMNNPIVVAPAEQNYSYTQTKADGSSINVRGSVENVVSVDVNDGERKNTTLESFRGDIPGAFS